MAKLGDRVTFTAPLLHHTETVKDGKIIGGSIYCVDQYEFAGIVGRLYAVPAEEEDGKPGEVADLFLLIPGKMGQWLKGIREGGQAGEFKVVK